MEKTQFKVDNHVKKINDKETYRVQNRTITTFLKVHTDCDVSISSERQKIINEYTSYDAICFQGLSGLCVNK